ncbi:TPR-like protein [Neoconidiobolus thromboides FSU 785]|nr:TPR-like protein [Neoconidiobolus thromboides FSU 785]
MAQRQEPTLQQNINSVINHQQMVNLTNDQLRNEQYNLNYRNGVMNNQQNGHYNTMSNQHEEEEEEEEYENDNIQLNEQFGHFAITTARYPEPWVNSPQPSYINFNQNNPVNYHYPVQGIYPMHQMPAFLPVPNHPHEALMIAPPTPNILSVYMYDHAMNYYNREYQPDLHLSHFFYGTPANNQGVIMNNQYALPPIQEISDYNSGGKQYNNTNDNYTMYNQQWGSRWNNNGQIPQYKTHGTTINSQYHGSFQNYQGIRYQNGQSVINNPNSATIGHYGNISYPQIDSNGVPIVYSTQTYQFQHHYVPQAPINLQEQYVYGTNVTIKNAKLEPWRDHLLQYAHSLYTSNSHSPNLLPLLITLNQLHPNHLPILLLLACVYYAHGNHQTSLEFHFEILKIDPNYVEAMGNIGTTFRNMGQDKEAEHWWWKAIKIRPTYWDAVENLIGLLTFSRPPSMQQPQDHNNQVPNQNSPRYSEAYKLCCYVESHVLGNNSFEDFCKDPCQILGQAFVPRFQNLLYSKGNMMYAMGKINEARKEYERALQLIFGGFTLFEIIAQILALYLPPEVVPHPDNLSKFELSQTPNVLLPPHVSLQLYGMLFANSGGILPGMLDRSRTEITQPNFHNLACQTTSVVILTLAKIYQDTCINPHPLSLLLPLYYLSLSLYPSPSTCNNLGILLSNIPAPLPTGNNQPPQVTGGNLALQYYSYGLTLDARHPHLYTNLGSLLKDMGNIGEAIRMYEKAVECNPKFDVALANLGNALKDSGRTQDSIQWYMRAVEINPEFTEAVCGLVNALGGICDWRGRHTYKDPHSNMVRLGWMDRIIQIVNKQLISGSDWGRGVILSQNSIDKNTFISDMLRCFQSSKDSTWKERYSIWQKLSTSCQATIPNEGGWAMRAIEKAIRKLQRLWYWKHYKYAPNSGKINLTQLKQSELALYKRPDLPKLPLPPLPTVLPFHTFTYPLTPRQVRLISHRNALRIAHSTLTSPWLPSTVYPPPPPALNKLRLGYVSSDFANHPLAHLMQSVFGFHDREKFDVFLYATTPNDNSPYRAKIQSSTPNFIDVSGWSTQAIVERIVQDGIHILINLNGYTKGARNEVFAARPAPILMSYMGFAGTLGGHWCDWFIADPIVCPPQTVCSDQFLAREEVTDIKEKLSQVDSLDLDPEEASESWVYTEKLIYLPHSYFVNDHRQGFRDPDDPDAGADRIPLHPMNRTREDLELAWLHEEDRRWRMRQEVFPGLHPDTIIFANFNQLYKLDPAIYAVWINVLRRVPNSVLWLLRFPAAGEAHLKRTAMEIAGPEVANRVLFTDVAPKHIHIHRGRIADLFFDTPECNAHTTAADILWSGTPIVTFARHMYKMCSRVAASIAYATGYGEYMVTESEEAYADQAVKLALSVKYRYLEGTDNEIVLNRLGLSSSSRLPPDNGIKKNRRIGHGELIELRKALFLTRDYSRLFDTPRWVKNLEHGYLEAWKRWENGTDDIPVNLSYQNPNGSLKSKSGGAYLQPEYRNHLQEYLKEKWEKGNTTVRSACIWVNDDDDDISISKRALKEVNAALNMTQRNVGSSHHYNNIPLNSNRNGLNPPAPEECATPTG